MNEVLQQLYARKSVRAFEESEITPQEKQAILRAAFEAPTAGNQQLYTILDITDSALKQTLSETCDHQPFIAKAPMVLIFCADCQKWLDAYEACGCAPRRPGPGDLLLAMADACIAAQNAVTAAQSLGIGSCYIGDILENCEQHRACRNMSFRLPCWCLGARRPASLRAKSRAAVRASFWCMKTVTAACRQASFAPCWAIRRRRGPMRSGCARFVISNTTAAFPAR